MNPKLTKTLLLAAAALLGVIAASLGGFTASPATARPDNIFSLIAPPFVTTAHAQGEAPLGGSFPDDEVGIAGYFNAGVAIDLNDVVGLFTTIEDQTADYILGSMTVPGYGSNDDIHVYIHTSGWVMIYYRNSEPTSKIFDNLAYGNGLSSPVVTRCEPVGDNIAVAIGIASPVLSYYHFSFPNANTMMLIADGDGDTGGVDDNFEVQIPGTNTYFERSWWAYRFDFYVNGVFIGGGSSGWYKGTLTSAQLPADTLHSISMDSSNTSASNAGLVLIYLEP